MSQELLYTSAPNGLKPGSRGFCTVLSTQGMPAPLATAVEGLSGYRPIYPPSDERASQNPIVFAHLKLQAAGRSWDVLSRVADYGLDYSGRPNKLAHHVIVDKSAEKVSAGPAALLAMPGFMRTQWQGEPKVVALKTVTRAPEERQGVCINWQEATGDAGWAGVIAESFLANPDRLVFVFYEAGQSILPLFEEAISLLPPDKRWDVTFSTYFTGLLPGTTCNWRGIISGTKEANESKRFVDALRIDLNQPPPFPDQGGELVEAARSGDLPEANTIAGRSVQSSDDVEIVFKAALEQDVSFASAYDVQSEVGPRKQNLKVKVAPPRLSKSGKSSIANGRLLRYRSLIWGCVFAAVLGFSVLLWRSFPGRSIPIEAVARNANPVDDESSAEESAEDKSSGKSSLEQEEKPENTLTNISKGEVDPGASHEPPKKDTAASQEPLVKKDPKQDTLSEISAEKVEIESPVFVGSIRDKRVPLLDFELKNGARRPNANNFVSFWRNASNQGVREDFRSSFGELPPTLTLYAPPWFDWRVAPNVSVSAKDVMFLKVEDVSRGGVTIGVCTFNCRLNEDNKMMYTYNIVPDDKALFRLLAWCGVGVEERGRLSFRVFREPAKLDADSCRISKDREVAWMTDFPRVNFGIHQYRFEQFQLRNGDRKWEFELKKGKTKSTSDLEYVFMPQQLYALFPRWIATEAERAAYQITISPNQDQDHLRFKLNFGPGFRNPEMNQIFAQNLETHVTGMRKRLGGAISKIKDLPAGLKAIDDDLIKLCAKPAQSPLVVKDRVSKFIANARKDFEKAFDEERQSDWKEIDSALVVFQDALVDELDGFESAMSALSEVSNADVASIRISVDCVEVRKMKDVGPSSMAAAESHSRRIVVLELNPEGGQK